MAYEPRVWRLASGNSDACAYGPTDWKGTNGDWRATLHVAANDFEEGELKLEMVVRPGHRAAEPTVLLMNNGETVRRVDVNQIHRENGEPRLGTHVQGAPPPKHLEWLEGHAAFKTMPVGSSPDAATYLRIFNAAASVIRINVAGVDWIDPPEGRP